MSSSIGVEVPRYHSKQEYEADQARRATESKRREALRKKFNESERILNLLRTQGAATLQAATDEEVETWAKANQISAAA